MNASGRPVRPSSPSQEQTVIAGAADEPLVADEVAPIVPERRSPAPVEARAGRSTRAASCASRTATRSSRAAPSGEGRTVGVVIARFNGEITGALLESALTALDEEGVARDAVTVMPVPGAFELPLAAMALAKTRRYACIVALGAVIRGDTPHFDYVAGEAASGLQLAALETGVPVAFGVLTTDTVEQARGAGRQGRRGRAHRARDGRRLHAAARPRTRPGRNASATLRRPCHASAPSAARSPASATAGAIPWSRRSAASTRTCSACA